MNVVRIVSVNTILCLRVKLLSCWYLPNLMIGRIIAVHSYRNKKRVNKPVH